MRRKEREHNEPQFFDDVFQKAETLFLALMDGDSPYCLPVNFARAGNVIYIHSALEGHKLDLIRQNSHAAFSLAADIEIIREKATTRYKSVCGKALARIVEDETEKGLALEAIGSRYNAICQRPAPQKDIRRVAIIRLDITAMSGKACT